MKGICGSFSCTATSRRARRSLASAWRTPYRPFWPHEERLTGPFVDRVPLVGNDRPGNPSRRNRQRTQSKILLQVCYRKSHPKKAHRRTAALTSFFCFLVSEL